jgi:leucyl-tRNA synthetase
MFPYPSGAGLHVGHPLGYIATDVHSRFRRMRGFNVLHPMGFDAFGLPAEQYAVEHGVHPAVTTESNIANMTRQLKRLGLGYDWERCLSTTDVDYYKWTQWIFLRLFHSWCDPDSGKARPISELVDHLESGRWVVDAEGAPVRAADAGADARAWSDLSAKERHDALAERRLAYLAEVPVNWCPALGTVLSNEEVTNEGRSDRGNHPVFKRPLKQWMLRITTFADRLQDDLETVDWPEPIKIMQRNWIGRSEGASIDFPIEGSDEVIRVFTTRPDTMFGATYMVLAPEHPLVDVLTTDAQREQVTAYRRQAESRSDVDRMAETKTKTGVFTGGHAINPGTGEAIPVWVADYVLMGYGTGAIMAVPAHDVRDGEFATQFGLPVRRVVEAPADHEPDETGTFTGDGAAINSANDEVSLNGKPSREAIATCIEWLERTGRGHGQVQYKLRDWLFSRQRYWGEPFPVLHAPDGRIVPVDDADLPVELPPMDDFSPTASDDPDAPPQPPLSRTPESWRFVEHDGERYERELNTMPQWAGSCWYYLRFCDPRNGDRLISEEAERYWMGDHGIDLYVGGAEHAVLHLLYARFWHKVLFDLGFVSTCEPFGRLFNQGYIQAFAYRDERKVAVPADEVVDQDGRPAREVQDAPDRVFSYNGQPVTQEYGKMGKSLKNIETPDHVCEEFGCDTLRLYEMYMGPLEASKPWNTRDIIGPFRFLQRVWRNFVDESTGAMSTRLVDRGEVDAEAAETIDRALHKMIAGVTGDLDGLRFNTAIAKLIEFNNTLVGDAVRIPRDVAERFVIVLSTLAPHVAEELWSKLGNDGSVAQQEWPAWDESMLAEDTIELPVQIMGKVRGKISVAADATPDQVEAAARADEKVVAALGGKTIRKVIVVPGRIVNIVAG